MAWPKKNTRQIQIGPEIFLWHISDNDFNCKDCSVTIGKARERFVLYLDPYRKGDMYPTPSVIREVLEWAMAQGWSAEQGPTRPVGYSEQKQSYAWLPDGFRHMYRWEQWTS